MPPAGVRLRQVALVARDLDAVAAQLEEALALPPRHEDPDIVHFGLRNAVWAVGDTFLEVVSPVRGGTTAGRWLDRRGGDAGYMALLQVGDLDAARARLPLLGVRAVWQADLADIRATHLDPRDVPGAIVSLDEPRPPGSWRWAGPRWQGGVPADREPGGLAGITVAVADPVAAGQRWAAVLGGVPAPGVRFTAAAERGRQGITEVRLTRPDREGTHHICGVRLHVRRAEEEDDA